MALFASDVPTGAGVRAVVVPKSLHHTVRAYGFAQGSGYIIAIFNNTLSTIAIKTRVRGAERSSFTATLDTYGKTQYDRSKENHWIGPAKQNLGRVGATVPLALPPYSVSILQLR
jgi:hypothetical protein